MKISVISALYNSEATVGQALKSVASQTYRDVEHLVIEGQSSDNSLGEIDRSSHPRMRLISEPDNGIYDALNKGIAHATGDVIGFMHSDDCYPHDEVLVSIGKAFEDPAVEAAFGDLDYVAKDDTSRIVRHWVTGAFTPKKLRRGWMPPHPTLFLRREVYEQFGCYDSEFLISGDYDFILRYFSNTTGKHVYIPKVLYKMRSGGLSNRNLASIRQKTKEDMLAIRRNRVGGLHTLAFKNFSKVGQFILPI